MEYVELQMIGLNPSFLVEDNGFNSGHAMLKHGVTQGSVLGPILFLIYINYLNHAIKYCKVHHYADETNLLHFNSLTKKK